MDDSAESIDQLVIFNDGVSDTSVVDITADGFTGAGTGSGVAIVGLETVDLLMGSGDDTVTVHNTAAGQATAVHGGGGSDTLTATGRGDNAPLVLFGDTAQDGSFYTGNFGEAALFTNHGDDVISAAASVSSVVIYGGRGNDILTGSQAGDQIAGGSGSDIIVAGDGGNTVYGDSGFNVNLAERTLSVINTDSAQAVTGDNLIAGNDVIESGSGSDILFGDYGVVVQQSEVDALLSTSGALLATSVRPNVGGEDTIHAGAGEDIVIGGFAGDTLYGGEGHDILLGDHGLFDTSLPTDQAFVSLFTSEELGAADRIYGEAGDDIILGQQGGDTLDGGEGQDDITGGHNVIAGSDGDDVITGGDQADVILGDNGIILRSLLEGSEPVWLTDENGDVIRQVSLFDNADFIGGNDTIDAGAGDDRVFGQRGGDIISGGLGDDELVGGLGADELRGDAGHDVLIGDVGTVYRALNDDGTAQRKANGSWQKNVVLEDMAEITEVIGISSSELNAADTELAGRLAAADQILLTGAYNADGSRVLNPVTGAWDVNLVLVNLVPADNDTVYGGDGDDIIIGQRGDDALHGDNDNDQIYGDSLINTGLGLTERPLAVSGLRILQSSAATVAGLHIGALGQLITSPVTVEPQILNLNKADNILRDGLYVLPTAVVDMQQAAGAGQLVTVDGVEVRTLASFIPSVIGHEGVLAGNDTITGGAGDDWLVGDNTVITTALDTRLHTLEHARIDVQAALEHTANKLNTLIDGYHALTALESGDTNVHEIRTGNDDIDAGEGNDLVVGDNLTMISGSLTGLPVSDEAYVEQAVSLYNSLSDLQHGLVDFGFTLREAHDLMSDELDDALSEEAQPSYSGWSYGYSFYKTKSRSHDLPVTYSLSIGNDTIHAGGGDDWVVGDHAVMAALPVNGDGYNTSHDWYSYKQAKYALYQLAHERSDQLASHIYYQHLNWQSYGDHAHRVVIEGQLHNIVMGNDTIYADAGDDLVIGDSAVLALPVIQNTPENYYDHWKLKSALHSTLNDIEDVLSGDHHHDWSYGYQFFKGHHNHHHYHGEGSLTVGNDEIYGGEGDDLLLGDSQSLVVSWLADSNQRFDHHEHFHVSVNVPHAHKHGNRISEDRLFGEAGEDRIYGQQGDDELFGGDDHDHLYGGSGYDRLDGGAGWDRHYYSGSDSLRHDDRSRASSRVFDVLNSTSGSFASGVTDISDVGTQWNASSYQLQQKGAHTLASLSEAMKTPFLHVTDSWLLGQAERLNEVSEEVSEALADAVAGIEGWQVMAADAVDAEHLDTQSVDDLKQRTAQQRFLRWDDLNV